MTRNGKLLKEVFENHNLVLLNESTKCNGKITRQNTKNPEEKSAIDFIVCSESIEENIISMSIDKEGLIKIEGKTETDHNTILLNIKVDNIDYFKPQKQVVWRLNAPDAIQPQATEIRKSDN